MGRAVLVVVAVLTVAGIVYLTAPDVKRYLRMRAM